MTEIQTKFTPRFVAYCCTHDAAPPRKGPHDPLPAIDHWLSMDLLTKPGQQVTHVNLGQWRWAPNLSTEALFLNDELFLEPHQAGGAPPVRNGRIYDEVKELQAKGIKVLTQLTFFWYDDGFGQEGAFNEHLYGLLHSMLSRAGFDGVDLDVETKFGDQEHPGVEAMSNAQMSVLIKRLKQDFGPQFLITMAPGGDELTNARNMSAIRYPELYKEIGEHIDWFNVQLYNTWGELTLERFETYMKAGGTEVVYPPEKLVMSVASNRRPTTDDWTPGALISDNLHKILKQFPNMGGICCWEWYDAHLTKEETAIDPGKWFRFVYKALRE